MPAALELPGLALERPWGLLGLLVPLAVWLLAARHGRQREAWTGTLELWREVAAERPPQPSRRRRLPAAVRWLLASLVAAALASTGPRLGPASAPPLWTVVVDLSPSMHLPWVSPPGQPAQTVTRLERGIERVQSRLAGARARGEEIAWLGLDAEGAPALAVGEPAGAWTAPGRAPRVEPEWSAHDAPGTLWLTDTVPAVVPRHAGLVASGGDAIPGPMAALGEARVEWDGQRLALRPGAGPRPAVLLEPGLGAAVERVVRAWAAARSCDVVAVPQEQVVLAVTRLPGADDAGRSGATPCGRDGWSWEPELASGDRPPGQAWLATPGEGEPVVAWQPGRVVLAAGRYETEPQGDPADFALSWAELLDRAALPPAGVVPVAERRDAGVGGELAGEPPPAVAGAGADPAAAWLAAAAALLALAALGAGRR